MSKKNLNEKIDFVVTWVDGSDPKWLEEKAKYSNITTIDNRPNAYRDWDLLKYWFRGVEKFAPWVNKVHFVTCGHIPSWLNTECPKLNIAKHSDFIPKKYLPTFSANPIELNLHRIQGISNKFVFFNDDMYLIKNVKPDDFFKNGKPREKAALSLNLPFRNGQIQQINNNDISLINSEYNFHTQIKNNFWKWINIKNGKDIVRTIWLLPCPRFPGIKHDHSCTNMLKATYEYAWKKFYKELDYTCGNRFRTTNDNNQWLIKDIHIASGNFIPIRQNNIFIDLQYPENFCKAKKIIIRQKKQIICLNDAESISDKDFAKRKAELAEAFKVILSQKSEFEK